jgi:hypothetical protein
MKSFLRFFSLTVANQICGVLSQLVLLPLMLRTWGHDVAAQWFVIVAMANLTTVFDLGLHNAGHSQLLAGLDGDPVATQEFRHTWALTRVMIVGLTAVYILYQMMMGTEPFALACIMIGYMAIDTTLAARGVWFDTLGRFNRVEGGFLLMAIVRLAASIPALIFFHASPMVIGWIMLFTSIGGIALQTAMLKLPLINFTAGGFRGLNWRSLSIIRLVVADPMTTWVRISLPVIILAAIAPSPVVTTFVALRAVFGFSRSIIWQLTRYASVRYIQHIHDNKKFAELIVVRAIQGTVVIGVAVSSMTIVDQGRLIHLWLGFSTSEEFYLVLSFAFSTIAFSYTMIANIMMRTGNVAGVAKRQYLYLLASVSAAVAIRFIYPNATIYLAVLAAQDILIAALFVATLGPYIMRSSIIAFLVGVAVLCLTITVVEMVPGGGIPIPIDFAISVGVALCTTALTLLALFVAEYFFTPRQAAYAQLS